MLLGSAIFAAELVYQEPYTTAEYIVDGRYISYENAPRYALQEATMPLGSEEIPELTNTTCRPQCVEYTRKFLPTLPKMRTPADLKPNASPAQGCAVILNYGGVYHIGYMPYPPFPGGVFVRDSNRKGNCQVGEVFVEFSDSRLIGFWCSP